MIRQIFLTVLLVLVYGPAVAPAVAMATVSTASSLTIVSDDLATDLQGVVDTFLADNPVAPGVVVYVSCPSHGLDWTGIAGYEDRHSDRPLTPGHTFRIASNTKAYVAVALLRLAELGKLDLDDALGLHLPAEYHDLLSGDGYDLQAMTLRQVLSHTAGLFEHPADPRYAEQILADPQYAWTPEEQVTRCVEWGDPVGAPGEKFSYSDTGYILLGSIIEKLTGENLGMAVHELCDYESLGLRSTWWEIMEEVPAGVGPRAHQYFGDHDTNDWHPGLDLYGGGGLLSDVRDLAQFMLLLMKGEVLSSEASLAAMTGGGTSGYRLGLICTELGGHIAYGHTGFWNTFAFHIPALDLTLSGCVLSHNAARGQELADKMVKVISDVSGPKD
ncbi:MAG: beta-lactamase family protein [Gemmatimonadales bacterium]|nr:beta-lactamase family protein [Gemmatimonadales bacterium]